MLEIKIWLFPHKDLSFLRHIRTCQTALLAVGVIKSEDFPQLFIILRIAEAHHRITVHEDAVAFIRNDERHRHLRVVLEKLLVLSFVIELISLMLSKAVESLVFRRLKDLPERPAARTLHFNRLKMLSASLLFTQKDIPFGIRKPYFSCRRKYIRLDGSCCDRDCVAVTEHFKLRNIFLRENHKALRIRKTSLGSCRDMNQLFAQHLKTHLTGTAGFHLPDIYRHLISINMAYSKITGAYKYICRQKI